MNEEIWKTRPNTDCMSQTTQRADSNAHTALGATWPVYTAAFAANQVHHPSYGEFVSPKNGGTFAAGSPEQPVESIRGGPQWAPQEQDFGLAPDPQSRSQYERTFAAHEREYEQRGPHTGKGPKGYCRSDERIHDDVCLSLQACGALDASEVEVTCEAGTVTLTGSAQNRRIKRLAEVCAESVAGVHDVMNRIQIERTFIEPLIEPSSAMKREAAPHSRS